MPGPLDPQPQYCTYVAEGAQCSWHPNSCPTLPCPCSGASLYAPDYAFPVTAGAQIRHCRIFQLCKPEPASHALPAAPAASWQAHPSHPVPPGVLRLHPLHVLRPWILLTSTPQPHPLFNPPRPTPPRLARFFPAGTYYYLAVGAFDAADGLPQVQLSLSLQIPAISSPPP